MFNITKTPNGHDSRKKNDQKQNNKDNKDNNDKDSNDKVYLKINSDCVVRKS